MTRSLQLRETVRLPTIVRFVIAVLVVALHFLVLRQVSFVGVHPELLLLVPCLAGIIGGPTVGARYGFIAGLAADLFTSAPFGTSALAYTVAGTVVGAVGQDARSIAPAHAVLAALGTAVGIATFSLAATVAGVNVGSVQHIALVALVTAALNALLSPLIMAVLQPQRKGKGSIW